MQSSGLTEANAWLEDYNREMEDLLEDLTARRRARLREPDLPYQRLLALREEIAGWKHERPSRGRPATHEPEASTDRTRRSQLPILRLRRGRIQDVETSELLSRNTKAFERFSKSMDRHSEAADRLAGAAERLEAAAKDQAKVFRHQKDVMRALAANLEAHGETLDRRGDALLGAFANLAAEIRGWRNER